MQSERDKTPASEEHYSLSLRSVWEGQRIQASRTEVARQLLSESLRAVMAAPFTSVLTVLSICLSLLVLSGSLLIIENLDRGLLGKTGDLKLKVYLRDDVTSERAKALADEAKRGEGVRDIRFVTKEDALRNFRKRLGDQSALLEGLEQENPLPRSIEMTFTRAKEAETLFLKTADRFRALSEVELVQYNKGVLGQLGALVKRFEAWGTIATVGLLILTAFIIASTIRLALYSHRDEVSIKRLVGATDRYVRAPYIIEGAVEGLIGAVASVLAANSILYAIRPWFASDAAASLFVMSLEPLSFAGSLFVIAVGVVVGIIGSWLSVRGFIRSSDVGII